MHRCLTMAVRPPHFAATSIAILLSCASLGLGIGCRKSLPNGLVPVSGCVRLDGKPLAEASITFISSRDQVPGRTDANGRYELQPGAAANDYRVIISKLEGSPQAMLSVDPAAASQAASGVKASSPPKQAVPARYSDPVKTELRFTVSPPGTSRADFDLVTTK